ncbi:PH domain-containing protein [Solirubrobacter phytolaccae]|uniref:PH domain-containing protein n=1 Tax=Solirubrobacter phytolaccae TaxID=1404360 RepID=A0A9X3NG43_9ACTN|nr:PH domain-containing protein [Solirubrobacter phytolaccae]MDA0183431.1 PH domain-containing protein [Solirubrobacter phytolaccae]
MELHPDEQIVFEGHPSWRAVLSFYIGGVAGALVLSVIVWLAAGFGLAILAFALLVAGVVLAGMVKRTATDYMVSTQRLYIRRGILAKKVQQTQIDRVQNVNTEQRFRDRLLRVGTVDFDTAGSDDSEFRFVGIAEPARVVAAVDNAQRNLKQPKGV